MNLYYKIKPAIALFDYYQVLLTLSHLGCLALGLSNRWMEVPPRVSILHGEGTAGLEIEIKKTLKQRE